jgi:uracil-DNA glycosylase
VQLQETIIACRRCPRLVTSLQQVANDNVRRFRHETYWGKPVPSFGDAKARLVIIGLLPLGKIAFDACLRACSALNLPIPTPRPRFGHGLHYQLAANLLLASYHPSQQNTHTGRLTRQMFHAIFATARALLG